VHTKFQENELTDKLKGNIQIAWLCHIPIFVSFRIVQQTNRNEIAYYHIIISVDEFYSAIPPRSIMPFSPALSTYTFLAMLKQLF
jgi:hypothetical protein